MLDKDIASPIRAYERPGLSSENCSRQSCKLSMPAFRVAKAFHVMGRNQPATDLQAGMGHFQGLDEHTQVKVVEHLACDDSIEFSGCQPYRKTCQHNAHVMK
jgi:hypothetical protein